MPILMKTGTNDLPLDAALPNFQDLSRIKQGKTFPVEHEEVDVGKELQFYF